MSYYQGRCNTNHRRVSSAQTNRTQVLTWEKHLALYLQLLILGLFSARLGSPRNKLFRMSKTTENRVWSKKLWLFSVRWLMLFLRGRQCRPCTVTMTSFWILTASLSGMSIYTHPMAPDRAADAPDLPNPFQSLVWALPNPLFVRVKCLMHDWVLGLCD
jgi:hypothetical protein